MFPLFTGDAAGLIKTSERRLNELVRAGKIRPAPRIVRGRRLWNRDHVLQAAKVLDSLTAELRRTLEANPEAGS